MIMATSVDAAEKEASEVLHSLLSVVKRQKERQNHHQLQNSSIIQDTDSLHTNECCPRNDSLFDQHFPQTIEDQPQVHDVVWQGHTIQVETNDNGEINLYRTDSKDLASGDVILNNEEVIESSEVDHTELILEDESGKDETKCTIGKSKKVNKKNTKKKVGKDSGVYNWDPTKLEDNPLEVKERFKRGCECQDESCFRGLSADSVYKHRLNIAELTKAEHDMYLMGVTMACLANPDITVRHKERQRLRAQYVYQGRRVCLDAFLYLENCTHYQLKRIRKHVMTHGVAPRVHGNHGKKPHNTFSLDIYQHATEFLKQFLETHNINTNSHKSPIQLPWDITRKNLHNSYKEYGQLLAPDLKLMGYSTFRHFLKEQFPNVRFCKIEPKSQQVIVQQQQPQQQQDNVVVDNTKSVAIEATVQEVIPLVVSQQQQSSQTDNNNSQTFLVAPVPVSQLIPNGTNTFPYQITNSYVINNQGNIVTTMANQYINTFNRI